VGSWVGVAVGLVALAGRVLQASISATFQASLAAPPSCMQAGKHLPCSHCVHTSCLLAWLQQQSSGGSSKFTCPLCRADLDVQPPPSKHQGPLRSLGLAIRGLLLIALELLAAAGQSPPPRGSPAPGSRAAERGRRQAPGRQAAHAAPADARAVALAIELSSAGGGIDAGPSRRVTRSQARLAAAQAAAQAAAAPPSRGPSRPRRRIDNIMD